MKHDDPPYVDALRLAAKPSESVLREATVSLESPEREKLIRFARLRSRASEIFEAEEAARAWLKTPAVAFGGESPLSFADTEIGAREVELLLGRLEHGVFS